MVKCSSKHERLARLALFAAGAAWLSGCASGAPQPDNSAGTLPPITSPKTDYVRQGKFVWHDLVTPNLESSKRFYGQLFGWSFRTGPDGVYTRIVSRGRDIGGMFDMAKVAAAREQAQWFSSVSVRDVDATVAAFEDHGARVLTPPRDLPDRGRYAVVEDAQGAEVVLLRSTSGDPADGLEFRPGDFLWTELWTRDALEAAEHYGEVFGYAADLVEGVRPYYVLKGVNNRPRAGIGQLPADADVEPAWLPYIAVRSAEDAAARVETLGGRVVISPDETRGESAAVFVDPTGAAFAVQEWPASSAGGGNR